MLFKTCLSHLKKSRQVRGILICTLSRNCIFYFHNTCIVKPHLNNARAATLCLKFLRCDFEKGSCDFKFLQKINIRARHQINEYMISYKFLIRKKLREENLVKEMRTWKILKIMTPCNKREEIEKKNWEKNFRNSIYVYFIIEFFAAYQIFYIELLFWDTYLEFIQY